MCCPLVKEVMKKTLTKFKVEYQTREGGIFSKFDEEIETLAEKYKLKFSGSGVYLPTGVRDLEFEHK